MEASVKLQTRCDLDPTRTTRLYDPLIDKTILLRPMLFVFFSFFLAVFNNNNNNFPRVNANEFVRSFVSKSVNRNRMDCRLEGKGGGEICRFESKLKLDRGKTPIFLRSFLSAIAPIIVFDNNIIWNII